MPIYEYLCQDCSYTFELKQSIKDEPVATCSKCGKSVSRIISAPAIMFKGTGWYVTDYSDKLKPPSGESSKPTPTSSTPAKAETASTPASTPASAASSTPPASGGSTGSASPSTGNTSTSSGSSSSS